MDKIEKVKDERVIYIIFSFEYLSFMCQDKS